MSEPAGKKREAGGAVLVWEGRDARTGSGEATAGTIPLGSGAVGGTGGGEHAEEPLLRVVSSGFGGLPMPKAAANAAVVPIRAARPRGGHGAGLRCAA